MNDKSIEKWIADNRGLDFPALMLKAAGDPEKQHAAIQAEARRKAASKIPNLLTCKAFCFPSLLSAEQCTSEDLALYHASLVAEGSSVADLTTGLGVDAIHLAARAAGVTSVEIDCDTARSFADNIAALGIGNVTAVTADSMEWIATQDVFDYIFIDPYRRDDAGGRVFSLSACRPDVVEGLDLLLAHCRSLIIKASPMLDLSETVRCLGGHARRVVFVGTKKECKEMVIICTPELCAEPAIEAVTITGRGSRQAMEWTRAEERDSQLAQANPAEGGFLYEPYPAVMKGGAYRLLTARYGGVAALSAQTHLYCSEALCANLPAAVYRIERVMPFDKRSIKTLSKEFTHLNVAVRNFPLKAPELEKRLGTKPGGDRKVYGCTFADGSRKLILVRTFQTDEP